MACFRVLHFLIGCTITLLLSESIASPMMKAYKAKQKSRPMRLTSTYKAKQKSGLMRSWSRTNNDRYMAKENYLSTMLQRLKGNLDDPRIRHEIMNAQMNPSHFLNPNRMEAAYHIIKDPYHSTMEFTNSSISTLNGIHLQIFDDGTVNGTNDPDSPYVRLVLESVGVVQKTNSKDGRKAKLTVNLLIRIKGFKSQRYLVYESNERLKGVKIPKDASQSLVDDSIFELIRRRNSKWNYEYDLLRGKNDWYLGFRPNRKMKKGSLVLERHITTQLYVNAN